ncbi:MAG: phosphatidylserine decarboxylase [Lachnospiraceae bacterium]|nr:phosphatidylserine decarboxylase [Lachnospiraceae bacterium]
MKAKDRAGNIVHGNEGQEKVIRALYGSAFGRAALKVLTAPAVSKFGGEFLDSSVSRLFIKPFVKKSGISLDSYEDEVYESYNQFFTRRIKEGERAFIQTPEILTAPCDSKLSVQQITKTGTFSIKNTAYTMESLLRSKTLAEKYAGGILLIFRLTVDDYHHFAYIDGGEKTKNYRIPGVLHTVNPIAGEIYPIYKENSREFSVLKSRNFGRVLMMEVGALMVGRIVNHHEAHEVKRGMEKGFFEFGGSTVILAFEKGRVEMDEDIVRNTEEGFETVVKQGERIGRKSRLGGRTDRGYTDCRFCGKI